MNLSRNEVLTFGIEEEFFVVDAHGRLSREAGEILDEIDEQVGDLQHELNQSQAESATGICRTAGQALGQLHGMRSKLAAGAARRGLRLIPSGTAPVLEDDPPGITPNPRYRRMVEHFGATVRSVTTCGCHVHIAMPDRETGVEVINHLRPWLPVLLAMTANSAIEGGQDTGYHSWRYQQWTQWPSSGPPPRFDSLDHYETIIEAWLRSGAILDREMVYWDIRLSEKQPTLEVRISDVAATAEEATLLAVSIRGLVATALRAIDDGVRPSDLPNEVLRVNLWRAARDGLAGQCLHPFTGELTPSHDLLDALRAFVAPALRSAPGDAEYLEEGFARLRSGGGGACRQRKVFQRNHRAADVVDNLAVPVDGPPQA